MYAGRTWTVHTEVFEGPLDLLLYLVRRDGIDLREFPVRQVADAYLAYLDRMRDLHLGIAAEYLVMAAKLIYLKSLELLPRRPTVVDDDDDEGEDPREALARRLREYQRYKQAAEELDERVRVGRETFMREPIDVPDEARPVRTDVDAFGLLEIYYDLLTREPAPEPQHEVHTPSGPDFATCCRTVLRWLGGPGGRGDLGAFLRELPTRVERVVTFVAVLEMARLQWLDLAQEGHLAPVLVTSKVQPGIDLDSVSGDLVAEMAG